MSKNRYILENADYDGYNQAFNEIGSWDDVLSWAKDGSIEKGDVVYKLVECRQPKIKPSNFD